MRFETIKAIDEAGYDLRLWCFACARGAVIDGIMWGYFEDRGWPLDLAEAAKKFPCKVCRSAADVLILPATCQSRRDITGANFVSAFFHGIRSASKKAKANAEKK